MLLIRPNKKAAIIFSLFVTTQLFLSSLSNDVLKATRNDCNLAVIKSDEAVRFHDVVFRFDARDVRYFVQHDGAVIRMDCSAF